MKSMRTNPFRALPDVRPLAGAGIEILKTEDLTGLAKFAPSRGRELKSFETVSSASRGMVRPLAGAGIEIFLDYFRLSR